MATRPYTDDVSLELGEAERPKHHDGDRSFIEVEEYADCDIVLLHDGETKVEMEESTPKLAMEYTVPTANKLMALGIYFLCNVGLTLFNKALLGSFRYPWLLTAWHTGCASMGCWVMMLLGHFKLSLLTSREEYILFAFSVLFTLNIAISNVSLAMVSIPFHQVVRATSPIVTTLIYRVFFSRSYSWATYLSLLPITLGVCLATFGDYSFTALGFLITFLGVLTGAFKTIVTNRLMTGTLKLAPLEFLLRMSPFACLQSLIYSVWAGEVSAVLSSITDPYQNHSPSQYSYTTTAIFTVLIILSNGLLAFCLNVSSFSTNKIVGALTMTVCGNVKQCLTIILGIVLFNVHIGVLNAAGLVLTVCGAAAFSFVELHSKKKKEKVKDVVGGSNV